MALIEARSRARGLHLLFLIVVFVSRPYVCELHHIGTTDPEEQKLSNGFYSTSCPEAELTVEVSMHQQYRSDPSTAPAMLRMIFHDCLVQGCDASVLLNTTQPTAPAERDASPNKNSLRGFEVLDMIKGRLEDACPGVVSCADLIALAARESVALAGGPRFAMPTGRRDSTTSTALRAELELPHADDGFSDSTAKFRSKGLDEADLVTLLGAHTIGSVHCGLIKNMDAKRRLSVCSTSNADKDALVYLDTGSGRSFDTHYYYNVLRGKALLPVDQDLKQSLSTYLPIAAYELDTELFFDQFIEALVKMSAVGVLTGEEGEIRRNCSFVNHPWVANPYSD